VHLYHILWLVAHSHSWKDDGVEGGLSDKPPQVIFILERFATGISAKNDRTAGGVGSRLHCRCLGGDLDLSGSYRAQYSSGISTVSLHVSL
jgi:hypothetical protein